MKKDDLKSWILTIVALLILLLGLLMMQGGGVDYRPGG